MTFSDLSMLQGANANSMQAKAESLWPGPEFDRRRVLRECTFVPDSLYCRDNNYTGVTAPGYLGWVVFHQSLEPC